MVNGYNDDRTMDDADDEYCQTHGSESSQSVTYHRHLNGNNVGALTFCRLDDPEDQNIVKISEKVPEELERDQWSGKLQFLLACIGNAVGLGNVWRFPYLCYKNGGGAFVIPYIITTLIIGFPLFLIEISLGQYSSMGPAHMYANLAPIFKGVGLASVVASVVVGIYYNMIIAWTLYYLVETFLGQKWQYCLPGYSSANCTTLLEKMTGNTTSSTAISSTEEFFNNYILGKSDGLGNMSRLQWPLVLTFGVAWIIVIISLIKGIQSSGKVVYFTATFPYVILVMLFIRGITLDGAMDGIKFYVIPDWSKIQDPMVWRDAAIQVFYSFGIAGGGMLTYSSYNKFRNPIIKHCILIGITDMLTSLFAGFVVFAMIGFMAHTLHKPVPEIVSSGIGLAFIAIPDGLSQLPGSIVWSFLYFLMLFLLGIDSQFACIETIITYIFDSTRQRSMKPNKPLIVIITCTLLFLLGLPLCTDAGIYILELMDHYAAGVPYLLIAVVEIVIVGYIYGTGNFLNDLRQMADWRPSLYLQSHLVVILTSICPIVIGLLLTMDMRDLLDSTKSFKSGQYVYPNWSHYIGLGFACIPMLIIPLGCLHHLFFGTSVAGSFWNRLRLAVTPTPEYRANAIKNGVKNEDLRHDTIKKSDIRFNCASACKCSLDQNNNSDCGVINLNVAPSSVILTNYPKLNGFENSSFMP